MVRVVLGRMGTGESVSHVGGRVIMVGGSLLLDGKRLAYKSVTVRDGWIDEHGRAWNTIDFEAVSVRERRPEDAALEETGS